MSRLTKFFNSLFKTIDITFTNEPFPTIVTNDDKQKELYDSILYKSKLCANLTYVSKLIEDYDGDQPDVMKKIYRSLDQRKDTKISYYFGLTRVTININFVSPSL